jgi:maleylpyruvate isomerase
MTYDHVSALAAIPAAQVRLSETLATLTDDEARAASVLPGWTRGHVVTHIARNAEAVARMAAGALRDEYAEQYPGGEGARDAGIEQGAPRPAHELIADVEKTSAEAAAALTAMTPEAWTRSVMFRGGRVYPATRLAWARWREVELHHADLGLARYTITDWPAGFVGRHLAAELAGLGDRLPAGTAVEIAGVVYGDAAEPVAVTGPDAAVLAWLTGRPGLTAGALVTSTGELPELPFWG